MRAGWGILVCATCTDVLCGEKGVGTVVHSATLTLVGIALLVIPGFVLLLAMRVKAHVAAVVSIPVTFGMVVVGSEITSAAGVPWNTWTALATLVIFLGLAVVYNAVLTRFGIVRPVGRSVTPSSGSPGFRRWIAARAQSPGLPWRAVAVAAAGVLVGIVTIYTLLYRGLENAPGGIRSLSNVWDEQWHANVIEFISDTGIAGATDLGKLFQVETHADFYYPDGWHALGSLLNTITGAQILPVINLWTVTCLALVVPLSAAALAWRVVRDRFTPTVAALAAGCAGAVSGLTASIPYVEVMTTANPNAVGAAMVGMTVVLVMSVTGAPVRIPLAVLAVVGTAGVHPSGGVFAALLLGMWWLFEALRRPRAGRWRDFGALLSVAVLAGLIMLPQILGVLADQDEIQSYDFTYDASRLHSLRQAFMLANWATAPVPKPLILLAFAVLACAVLLIRTSVWMTLAWGALLVAASDAIQPFGGVVTDVLTSFTSAFYTDSRRIEYAIALVMLSLAGAGIALVVWGVYTALNKWMPARRGLQAGSLVVLLLAVPAGSVAASSLYGDRISALVAEDRAGRMVSQKDRRAFEYLSGLPDAYETTIFVDPDQGGGWMYALDGLHPLFTHYAFPDPVGDRTWMLWDRLNAAGANPDVDAALRQLNVKYVLMSPPVYWPWQEVPPGLTKLDEAPGLTRIYYNGETRIYRVDGWRPPAAGENTYGWDPFADRSDAVDSWDGPPAPQPTG